MLRLDRIAQLLLVVALVGLDLAAKDWAQTADVTTHGPTAILPFLSLVLAYNPGLTFGGLLGLSQHPFLSTLLSASIIAALLIWIWREKSVARRFLIAFPLAGALGNTIDRSANSMVTDFLQIRFGSQPALVINLADLWIVIGIIGLLFAPRRPPRPPPNTSSASRLKSEAATTSTAEAKKADDDFSPYENLRLAPLSEQLLGFG